MWKPIFSLPTQHTCEGKGLRPCRKSLIHSAISWRCQSSWLSEQWNTHYRPFAHDGLFETVMQSSHALHEVDMELKLRISLNSVLHKQKLVGGGKSSKLVCTYMSSQWDERRLWNCWSLDFSVLSNAQDDQPLFFKLGYSNDRLPHYHQLQICINYLNHSQKTPFHLPTPCSFLRNKPACRNLPKDNACISRTNYPGIFPTLTAWLHPCSNHTCLLLCNVVIKLMQPGMQ